MASHHRTLIIVFFLFTILHHSTAAQKSGFRMLARRLLQEPAVGAILRHRTAAMIPLPATH